MKPLRTFGWLLLLFAFASAVRAEPLAIKEERLGAWHDVSQADPVENGVLNMTYNHSTPPTAVALGEAQESIAVLLPKSKKIAEFRAGVFTDLLLPDDCVPISLAVDRKGELSALVELVKYRTRQEDHKRRFVIHRGAAGWEAPVETPWRLVDRIEFDAAGRLWVFSQAPRAGFLSGGKWETYTYSDDRRVDYCPLRMADDGAGGVALFSGPPRYSFGKYGRMKGVLAWRDGRFVRDPDTSPDALLAVVMAREAKSRDDSSLERERGYVARWVPGSSYQETHPTIVHAGGCVLVSFGKAGLAWAEEKELAATRALRTDEWELVPDVTVRPALDAQGNLWIGRGAKLLKIGAQGTEEMKGDLPNGREPRLEFDTLDRPWVLGYARPIVVVRDGALLQYAGFIEALRGESASFSPGRVFRYAVKTPAGLIAVCDGPLENFTLLDGAKTRTFSELQINPKYVEPLIAHGYNPFSGGQPWYDGRGRLYTMLDEHPFRYDPVRRRWAPAEKRAISVVPPLEPLPWPGTISAPKERPVVYHSFHFFEVTKDGERQLDFGLNPQAWYGSWSAPWSGYAPVVEPSGRVWVCRHGPKPGTEEWLVLKR